MNEASQKRQCKNCPWKKGADVSKIPNYVEEQHVNLRGTIADAGSLYSLGMGVEMMACHNSTEEAPYPCVGWAVNQLGPGNNIPLRLMARRDERLHGLETVGPQHESFEDTLPACRRVER